MSNSQTRLLRRLIAGGVVLLGLGVLWILLGTARTAIALWHEWQDLPAWLGWSVALVAVGVLALSAWFVRGLLRPAPRRVRAVEPPRREVIEQRVAKLSELKADTAALSAELEELERRGRSGEFYVAVFGEISSGKSSLVRALAPQAVVDVDVLGGTTTRVAHHRGRLDDGRDIVLADVPGSQEVDGRVRESLARDEALRAHAVLYVCAGDLTRQQDEELRWLDGFGKPLVLVVAKADQWDDAERTRLQRALRKRYADVVDALVAVSAGGSERFERELPDGRREQVTRERVADLGDLKLRVARLLDTDPAELERARETAVLAGVSQHLDDAERSARRSAADAVVERYTRRAVVGALAAVAPGSDLVIQGALATGLLRELARIYDVSLRDIDLDAFLARAALTVRTATTVVLAVAGNAFKAFPGLGTLGGGVMHAVAYGLIFDSLGRAVAQTLAEQQQLDQEIAVGTLQRLLGSATGERLRHVADLTLAAAREPLAGDAGET